MAYGTGYLTGYTDIMTVLTPDLFWLTGQVVLDCVCTSLTAESECGCPCRKGVVLGQPVWDSCCPDGQLTIFLDRVYVHANFPAQEAGPIFCSSPLAGEFTVQLIRCVPTVKDDGTPPTMEELSESARKIYQDMYIAYKSVICCLAASKRYRKFVMRDARTVGPQGGCAGFEIRFGIELHDPMPI